MRKNKSPGRAKRLEQKHQRKVTKITRRNKEVVRKKKAAQLKAALEQRTLSVAGKAKALLLAKRDSKK